MQQELAALEAAGGDADGGGEGEGSGLLGRTVVLCGLSGKPEFNGRRGKVLQFDEERERYAVQLCDEASVLLLRAENVRPVDDDEGEEEEDDDDDGDQPIIQPPSSRSKRRAAAARKVRT